MNLIHINRNVLYCMLAVPFLPLFFGCNKTSKINNKYLTAIVPENYADITNPKEHDILFLDNSLKNGLESVFSIDNTQDLTIQPNAQTIKEFTPKQILDKRLRSIEEETKASNCNWQNFKLQDLHKTFVFKNKKAAEATFTVDENVNGSGRIVRRKIRRMVIFTENDLWNFVLAPSEYDRYNEEMKVFDKILESITIKK